MRAWSVESSFFLQAVGEALGMGATDFACLTLLLLEGPLGAGAVAERSGLTTGAVTGLIDRLERGGWVRRVADPADRRRVIVEPVWDRVPQLRPILDPMLAAGRELRSAFDDAELATVERYVRGATAMLGGEVQRLRDARGTQPAARAGGSGSPLVPRPRHFGGRATLVLAGLAADLRVGSAALPGGLCLLDFDGRLPEVQVRGSEVTLAHRGRWWRGGVRGSVQVADDLAWAIEVHGGASHLRIELRDLRLLAALTVRGGASLLEIDLPEPRGTVPVVIHGGASKVTITRPRGVPVLASVLGGYGRLTVDGEQLHRRGGAPAAGGDPGRTTGVYELELRGGASDISVEAT